MKTKLSQFEQLLVLTSVLAICLVGVRIALTGTLTYAFMIWNLFLAYIPLLFASLACNARLRLSRYLFILLWLLFYPNALYVLTDYIHVQHAHSDGYVIYDFLLVSVFVLIAFVIGYLSLYKIYKLTESRARRHGIKNMSLYMLVFVSALTGFGIYLGRFLRLNSWDLLTNSTQFKFVLTHTFTRIDNFLVAAGTTLFFGCINFLLFFVFYRLFKQSELE